MSSLSVETTPAGFEVQTPSFGYWFKAGIAFTVGAGIVYVLSAVLWAIAEIEMPALAVIHSFTKF